MEILDNMPHDRIYRDDPNDPHSLFTRQAEVNISEDPDGNEVLSESQAPISDPLIEEFLKHYGSMP